MKHARKFDYADNNWKFFRILVDLGLEQCGVDFDRSLTDKYLEELEGFYLGVAGIATAMCGGSTITFPSPCTFMG